MTEKVSLFATPVFVRRDAVARVKDPVEIADVIVSHALADVDYAHGGSFQQKSGLAEALALHQLREGFSRFLFDLAAEPAGIVVQSFRDLRQRACRIIVLNVAENPKEQPAVVLAGVGLQRFRAADKLKKQKPHGELVDASFVGLAICQCPDQVFDQVLNGKDL